MITQLPIGQIIVIAITSTVLSLTLNAVRSDGIPLLAEELAVAEEIEHDAAEPRLLAITLDQALEFYQKGTVLWMHVNRNIIMKAILKVPGIFRSSLNWFLSLIVCKERMRPWSSIAAGMNVDQVRI